jgi:DNA-binding transcriptional regulator YiaG
MRTFKNKWFTRFADSEAASIAYEMAESLYKNGVINDDAMREFDDVCLLPEQAAIQRIQEPEQTTSYLPAYK